MGDPRGPLNPFVPPEPLLTWIETASTLSNLIAPPVFVLALASLFIRFRRSHDAERQQIKWFLFVAAVATVLFAVSVLDVGPVVRRGVGARAPDDGVPSPRDRPRDPPVPPL